MTTETIETVETKIETPTAADVEATRAPRAPTSETPTTETEVELKKSPTETKAAWKARVTAAKKAEDAKPVEQPKAEPRAEKPAKSEGAEPFSTIVDRALIKGGVLTEIIAELEASGAKLPKIGARGAVRAQLAQRRKAGYEIIEADGKVTMKPKSTA
jgi:hypothetical protein